MLLNYIFCVSFRSITCTTYYLWEIDLCRFHSWSMSLEIQFSFPSLYLSKVSNHSPLSNVSFLKWNSYLWWHCLEIHQLLIWKKGLESSKLINDGHFPVFQPGKSQVWGWQGWTSDIQAGSILLTGLLNFQNTTTNSQFPFFWDI